MRPCVALHYSGQLLPVAAIRSEPFCSLAGWALSGWDLVRSVSEFVGMLPGRAAVASQRPWWMDVLGLTVWCSRVDDDMFYNALQQRGVVTAVVLPNE